MSPIEHAPETLADVEKLEACFNRILTENMQGIPILNTLLDVQALEFKVWEGRKMGMMITPWFISLIILPNETDDWDSMELGTKEDYSFPARECQVMVNEIEGFGRCKLFSLYSPVRDFNNQESALAAAAVFFRDLFDESKRVEPTYSEEQIQRYLEKEDMQHQEELKKTVGSAEFKEEVNRRDLLRGKVKKAGS